MLARNISVDYDERSGRFIFHAPFDAVERMRAIPNRRWDSRRKVWTAPAIRANVQHMNRHLTDAQYTPTASRRMIEVVTTLRTLVQREKFPVFFPFKTKPDPHQVTALDRFFGMKAIGLFMDKGTGKSKVIADLIAAWHITDGCNRVVIVCPMSVRRNWAEELDKHFAAKYEVWLLDTTKQKEFAKFCADGGLKFLVVGVEQLSAGRAFDMAQRFLNASLNGVCVVDESTYIKNHAADRSKRCVSLGRIAERRIAATGTPTTKSLMDLYMQFEFMDPDIIGIGDFYSFRNRYAVMGGYEDKEIVGYQNVDELMEIIAPFTYQVHKKDVLDLPPKTYEKRFVRMNKEQERLYKQMKRGRAVKDGEREHAVKNVLERTLRLSEIAGGFVSYDDPDAVGRVGARKVKTEQIIGENPKMREVLNVLDETDAPPTIIWAARRPEIELIAMSLSHRYGFSQVVQFHGGKSEEERAWARQQFQEGRARFLVGTQQSGGIGITLTAAELVIYFSNTESFFHRDQSEDRAHRRGQDKSVTYIDIMCEDTVDELTYAALQQKLDLAQYVKENIDRAIRFVSE